MAENKYLKRKFPQLGSELNNIEYLLITYSLCISLYSRLSYTSIAVKVGESILYFTYRNKYLNKKSKNITPNITYNDYKNSLNIDNLFLLKLGDFFMSILQQFPHEIFVRKVNLDSYFTNEPYMLELNKEYLEDIKNNLIINPSALPMLCKPKEWSENTHGGFLNNEHIGTDIITSINEYGHKVENKELIYESVNTINSTMFGINTNLLDYLLSPQGCDILQIITPEDDLQRYITLKLAQLFRNTFFFLSTHADWRGRLYVQSFYLSYQAGDLALALLNFWEGAGPITEEGKFYLYIYGANSHNEQGISKASYQDRLKWVKNNYNKIINLDRDLIYSAESPFIFTAFCLNMKEIHNNPKAIIRTPVFLDATCSGVQHLAAPSD